MVRHIEVIRLDEKNKKNKKMKDKIIINRGDYLLELPPYELNLACQTIGNNNVTIKLLIDSDQYAFLLNFVEDNSTVKNSKKLLNIRYRIYKNFTSIVLLVRTNNKKVLWTIGNILYTNGPKYWYPEKIMKQYPAKMPVKQDNVIIYPEEEEIIFDYRPENILLASSIDQGNFSEVRSLEHGSLLSPEVTNTPDEPHNFYCAYHKGFAPIAELAVSSRCKECQYKWDIIDEARQWAKRRKLEFDLEWEVKDFIEIDDTEKEKSKNSTMINPGKLTNLYQSAPTHCYFSGTKLEYDKAGKGYKASIARLDSKKGYTADNCIVVAYAVNQLKRKYDWDDVINFFKGINQRRKNDSLQPDSSAGLNASHKRKLTSLVAGAIFGDKKGQRDADITKKDLSVETVFTLVLDTDYICKITNSSMYITTNDLYMVSIDRIDLDLSHNIENIQIISWGANSLKGSYFSTEETKKFINETYKFYKEHHLIK
jgi:hypothetical protein